MTEDKFIISSIKDSKRLSKVLSNDTSRGILELLAERPMSASQIAESMKMPLTTVDYSIKNLESVGLIRSRNGFNKNKRIVKYYEPQEKYIVLAPGKPANVLPVLKSMLPAIGIVGVISLLLEYYVRIPAAQSAADSISMPIASRAVEEASQEAVATTMVNPHYGLIFFAICLSIILIYASIKSYRNILMVKRR